MHSTRLFPLFPTHRLALLPILAALVFAAASVRLNHVAAQSQTDCPVRVTLLQVNDVYQFAPVDNGTRGGLARVATLRKKIMAESPHTLLLMAGDTISPSIESNTYKGAQMIEAWNAAGLDYATLGNHEFDFGPEVLLQRMSESKFKWLAANVLDKQTGKLFGDTPEFIVREFDGVKIGIFGILLPETVSTSRPGPNVEIREACATANQVIPKIRAAGAQVIVALTHLSMAEDKALARCSGVDVIIGGHEHTLLESMAGHAPIFKMTADAREMGRIDLNIDKKTGKIESIDWKVIPVTNEYQDDPSFAPIQAKYGTLLKDLGKKVGSTTVDLEMKSENVRTRETNMGNFIADAYRQATGADVALVNGGSIRADALIKPGPLTKRDVLSILPFNNKVLKIQITGTTLRTALEHGVGSIGVESQPGRFPQVSGIRFSYDASLKAGERVTSVTVNGRPLVDRQMYTLAATSYVIKDGGDGYTMFRDAKVLGLPDQTPSESEIMQKVITLLRPIAPKVEGRVTRVDTPKSQTSCK